MNPGNRGLVEKRIEKGTKSLQLFSTLLLLGKTFDKLFRFVIA